MRRLARSKVHTHTHVHTDTFVIFLPLSAFNWRMAPSQSTPLSATIPLRNTYTGVPRQGEVEER